MKTKFINLFGAPGAGKSTVAAGVYSQLSQRGYDVELVPEFAKELVWEDNASALTNQAYVTARQFYMIHRLDGQCRWVITDSPALLGAAYCTQDYPQCYIDTLKWYHSQTDSNMNYLIERADSVVFQQKGRVHSEHESAMVHDRITTLLESTEVEFQLYDNLNAIHHIVRDVMATEERDNTLELTQTKPEDVAILGGQCD
jgi:hypothetical protein